MTKVYSVWDGMKLKGQWTDRKAAVEYMAARGDQPRLQILVADVDSELNKEIDARRRETEETRQEDRVYHQMFLRRHADRFPNYWRMKIESGETIAPDILDKLAGVGVKPLPTGTVALRGANVEVKSKAK